MTDYVTIKGNLGASPWYIGTGSVPVARFNVGSTERRYNRSTGQWEDGHTNWHRIVVFREQACNVMASLHKGMSVVIHGRIRNRRYNVGSDENPEWKYTSEIEADHVGVDLVRGHVNFYAETADPPSSGGAREGDGAAAASAAAPEGEAPAQEPTTTESMDDATPWGSDDEGDAPRIAPEEDPLETGGGVPEFAQPAA
ncbi:hypothetical protein GCM10027591_03870 [Zhihengliuella somnathii]